MRILHTADIHLDSPMRGLVAYDGAPVEELRMAARGALRSLVDAAVDEQVDLVVIAGDIFDGDWPHYGTGVHFVTEMGRLREAGIPVVTIAGNHDAESKLTKSLRLPDNVFALGTRRPETKVFEGLGVAVHGQGYATQAVVEDLSLAYPEPRRDLINVGLLHTSASGRPGHERYAPCSVTRLAQRGYDYWALGHIHRREILCEDPPIIFPGNLQGRGVRETGPKGATLIEIADDRTVTHEHRVLDSVRWERVDVDATDCADMDGVCERVGTALRDAARGAGERLLAARVVISGCTPAHDRLVADEQRTGYEVVASGGDLAGGRLWIAGTDLKTSPPREWSQGGDDAVGELLQELAELCADDAAVAELTEVLGPLTEVLPAPVLADFDPGQAGTIRGLLTAIHRSLPFVLMERSAG